MTRVGCRARRRAIVVTAGLLLLLTPTVVMTKGKSRNKAEPVLDSKTPLTLQVTPKMAIAGTFVRALVRVHPHVQNRLLRVSVESPGYFRSSDVTLDGADAAVSHFVPLRALPAGSYQVVAVVYGSEGERARRLQSLELKSAHQGN